MRKLFKGGTFVSGKGTKRADVLVDGEKIVRVARSITDPLAQTVDVTGKFLLPALSTRTRTLTSTSRTRPLSTT